MRALVWLIFAILLNYSGGAQATEPARVVVLASDFVAPVKFAELATIARENGVELSYLNTRASAAAVASELESAQLVILDGPRPSDRAAVQALLPDGLEGLAQAWLQVGGGRPTFGNVAASDAQILVDYYAQGGLLNYEHFFKAVQQWHQHGRITDSPVTEALPETGIYSPNGVYADLSDFLYARQKSDKPQAPLIGFMISDNAIRNLQTGLLDSIYEQSLAAGLQPVLFWFEQTNDNALIEFWQSNSPAALVNLTHLQNGAARKIEFQRLDVPVLQASVYRDGDALEWQNDMQGLNGGAFATLMAVPESWGISDAIIIGAMADGEPQLIPAQFKLLTDKVNALVRLQESSSDQKQLALMFWNTPAGEENISASNLNIPRSLVALTQSLAEAGYPVSTPAEEQIIDTAKQLLSGLYHPEKLPGLADLKLTLKVSLDEYEEWFDNLPEAIRVEVTARWGQPGEHVKLHTLADEQVFLLPAARWGNLIVMPQPPRSAIVGEATHDSVTPPDHYYLAAYLALRRRGTDALIHFGTHGTQEWLPGKARGLSATDYPFLVLGNVPIFYPYIQDNVSEALQARRRGRAITISHQTPPFAPSGLYDELLSLHDLIHQYEQLTEGQVRKQVARQLQEQAQAMQLHEELGFTDDEITTNFAPFYTALHDHLHRLAASVSPLGLHSFGQPATPDERLLTVLQQLGKPYYQAVSPDAEELLAAGLDEIKQSRAMQLLRQVIHEQQPLPDEPELAELLTKAKTYYANLSETGEVSALLRGLEGRFVEAGLGGDPIRNPQTTSGTNLYAFDPMKVPTAAAYQAGEEALQDLISDYEEQHGHPPEKLAFSLWSSETQRHMGISEAQVLHALGLEPEWDSGGRLERLRVIPADQLKQPRIDVVLQLTSVYRDQFDGFMQHLATALDAIAALDDGNAIARSNELLAESLQRQGVPVEQVRSLSRIRMFSNEPGDYGSGVPDVTLDSTSWEDDSVIAEQFLQRLQYGYGSGHWGVKVEQSNLLAGQLKNVDAAVMSRSSNLHGLLSSDHPFEFLGGLASAIREVNGKDAELYISDLRQSESRMVGADRFISEELRSRYLNPNWLKGMQAEGYAGALTMLNTVNNLFGWQATAPTMVRDDQWESLHDVLIADTHGLALNEWFEEQQPAAQMQIIERMAEAIRKEYWDAEETTRTSLAERYEALQKIHPTFAANPVTQAFIQEMGGGQGQEQADEAGSGYGLMGTAGAPADGMQSISGQQLQQRQPTDAGESSIPVQQLILIASLLLIVVAGGVQQLRRQQHLKGRN